MIPSIIDRLKEPGTPFRIVGNAADLANVKDRPPQTPAAYVYVSHDASAPNEHVNVISQRTAMDIAIVIVTQNLSAANNAAAANDIETLKRYVRQKLLGFVPADTTDPLEHVEGEMQQAINGCVWFEDVFTGAYYQRATR